MARADYPKFKDELDEDDDWWDSEDADWFAEALLEALEDAAPPFMHFGPFEGDGACIGWWVDSFHDIKESGMYVTTVDLAREDLPEFILTVNDHGNMTLYRVNLEEIWSVV
jgi:hypothetical protein